SLVGGIDPTSPTPVSAVNGQINHIEAQILKIVNHDHTLATLATGTDAEGNATTGFVALPPATHAPEHNDVAPHFAHLWASRNASIPVRGSRIKRHAIFHFANANASAKIVWRLTGARERSC